MILPRISFFWAMAMNYFMGNKPKAQEDSWAKIAEAI